jgi:hypothetical protein
VAIADRAYGAINGTKACRACGADYILRLRTNCFAVYDENGNKVDIAEKFAHLKSGESSEAAVFAVLPDKTRIPVRICVRRKDKEGCEKPGKRLGRQASRRENRLQEKTAAFNELIVAATSLPLFVKITRIGKRNFFSFRKRPAFYSCNIQHTTGFSQIFLQSDYRLTDKRFVSPYDKNVRIYRS